MNVTAPMVRPRSLVIVIHVVFTEGREREAFDTISGKAVIEKRHILCGVLSDGT